MSCVNVTLFLVGRPEICQCIKVGHEGEPNAQQILDPDTGVVHAPGLSVDMEGKVKRRELPGIDDLISECD